MNIVSNKNRTRRRVVGVVILVCVLTLLTHICAAPINQCPYGCDCKDVKGRATHMGTKAGWTAHGYYEFNTMGVFVFSTCAIRQIHVQDSTGCTSTSGPHDGKDILKADLVEYQFVCNEASPPSGGLVEIEIIPPMVDPALTKRWKQLVCQLAQ